MSSVDQPNNQTCLSLNDVIEWDINTWSRSLDYWRKNSKLNWNTCKGLELGARRGGLSLWFANHGADMICSDLENPIVEAEKNHKQYQIEGHIEYQAINACDIPFKESLDFITFKSILGGIARNNEIHLAQKVLDSAWQALKPGGEILFCENLAATPIHSFARKHFVTWGNEWSYMKLKQILNMLKAFHLNWQSTGCLAAFGRNEGQKSLLANFDCGLEKIFLPQSFKYVFMAVAKKPENY